MWCYNLFYVRVDSGDIWETAVSEVIAPSWGDLPDISRTHVLHCGIYDWPANSGKPNGSLFPSGLVSPITIKGSSVNTDVFISMHRVTINEDFCISIYSSSKPNSSSTNKFYFDVRRNRNTGSITLNIGPL